MKEYHVVFEGLDKFQKEDKIECERLPLKFYRKEYAQLSAHPLFGSAPLEDILNVKDRCFRKRCEFYALGKNIAYYTEER